MSCLWEPGCLKTSAARRVTPPPCERRGGGCAAARRHVIAASRSHTSPRVDCAAWISSNKGIIRGALVPTRAGLITGRGGYNSRGHQCCLNLKSELHRFSGGTFGPSAAATCLSVTQDGEPELTRTRSHVEPQDLPWTPLTRFCQCEEDSRLIVRNFPTVTTLLVKINKTVVMKSAESVDISRYRSMSAFKDEKRAKLIKYLKMKENEK